MAGKGAAGSRVCLAIRAQPKASHNAAVGWLGDRLKIAITAAPTEGKANRAVEDVVADILGVRRSAVAIVAGHASRDKLVQITGLTLNELELRLAEIVPPRGKQPPVT